MGVFSNMRKVDPTQGGLYFKEGNYLVEILSCKLQESGRTKGKVFLIIETKVLESNNEEMKVGMEPSCVINMTGDNADMGERNAKNFFMAAYSVFADANNEERPEVEDIDEEACDSAIGEEQPLVGLQVGVKAFDKKKKDSEDVFTRINWHVPDEE